MDKIKLLKYKGKSFCNSRYEPQKKLETLNKAKNNVASDPISVCKCYILSTSCQDKIKRGYLSSLPKAKVFQ